MLILSIYIDMYYGILNYYLILINSIVYNAQYD